MPSQRLLLLFSMLFSLTACGSESAADPTGQNQLIGKWELQEAYRNGSPAASLEDLFFEFEETGQMSTNILGATAQSDYHFDGQKIVQAAGESGMEVAYEVEGITDTSLVLRTSLRRYDFKFDLRKIKASME